MSRPIAALRPFVTFATLPLIALGIFALILSMPSGDARAQQASPHGDFGSGVGDVPGGPGTIRGRVVRRAGGEGAEKVPVRLFALGTDGKPGMRQAETAADGTYRFGGIATDPGTVYLIAVQYGDIPFGSRLAFEPGQTQLTSTIEIADSLAASDAIEGGAVRIRLDRGCDGVRVTETHVLRNPTDFVLHVPPSERGTQAPIYGTYLPAAAIAENSTMPGRNMPERSLEQRGDEIAYWGPLYPGEQTIEFSYSLLVSDGSVGVTRRFERGAESVTLLTFRDTPPVRGESLAPAAEETIAGVPYTAVARGPLAADVDFPIAWDTSGGPVGADALSLREATIWLELDDAALDVREQYVFDVSGSEPLRSNSDAPLLCLPLPPEMEDLRFSAEAFAMGIEPGAAGGLALRGPVPVGRSGFILTYLLRSSEGETRFARHFGVDLSVLTLLIADTGVLTTTDRLHRRRPVRTSDRTYIHLEAFEIASDETVAVDLESLSPAQPLSRGGSILFVTASALLSVFFLVGPLRSRHAGKESVQAVEVEASLGERTAVYAAIRDLEDDFQTGKVSDEDRVLMLGELRAQAADLLRQERDRSAPTPTPAPTTRTMDAFCAGCGAALPEAARFCPQCGSRTNIGLPTQEHRG